MKNTMLSIAKALPAFIEKSGLMVNINLSGWPATVAIVSVGGCGLAAYCVACQHDFKKQVVSILDENAKRRDKALSQNEQEQLPDAKCCSEEAESLISDLVLQLQ